MVINIVAVKTATPAVTQAYWVSHQTITRISGTYQHFTLETWNLWLAAHIYTEMEGRLHHETTKPQDRSGRSPAPHLLSPAQGEAH